MTAIMKKVRARLLWITPTRFQTDCDSGTIVTTSCKYDAIKGKIMFIRNVIIHHISTIISAKPLRRADALYRICVSGALC